MFYKTTTCHTKL